MTAVIDEHREVYGVRKVWRQMNREGFAVALCTIERLVGNRGMQGVIRGEPERTTISDKAATCPLDQVNRQFHAPAPNMLWVSDFTYVATWAGFVLCGLRHQRLFPLNRGLVGQQDGKCQLRSGCAEASYPR